MADSSRNGPSNRQTPLEASYNSPTNAAFAVSKPLPAPTDKTAHLAALRKAAVQMQEQINKELTSRMEEDKAGSSSQNGEEQAKEEDNYGEEVPED